MEHLLTKADSARFADRIEKATWLGFDHDRWLDKPPESLEAYSEQSISSSLMITDVESKLQVCDFGISDFALLQSLSLLGIWEFLLQRRIPTAMFLVGFCPGATFSTQQVASLLSELSLLANQMPGSKEFGLVQRDIVSVLKFLSRWDGILLDADIPQNFHITLRLRRQVVLMLEAIYEIAYYQTENFTMFVHAGAYSDLYRGRLEKNGFCPSTFNILQRMGTSSLEYFCVTGRNNLDTSVTKHDSCDWQHCHHQTQSGVHSQARHLEPTCLEDCGFVAPSSSIIKRVILSGGYFVLDIARITNVSSVPDDAIVPYVPGLQYVAISHVWAHGLASDSDTGLPICQLRKLHQTLLQTNAVAELSTTYLWIDSLCIPRESELKLKSIAIMDQIYKNATVVTVLDAFLETVQYEDQSRETSALYIITSDWNKRLWTFQESKLAKCLGFLFKDEVKLLENIRNDLLDRELDGKGTAVTSQSRNWLQWLDPRSKEFFSWVNMFQFKSCSVVDDEPLVLSNLLGLSTKKLTTIEGPRRMAALWFMLSSVPKLVLFHSGLKLQIDGFRWAPSSFLYGSAELAVVTNEEAHVTQDGLRGCYIVVDFYTRLMGEDGEFSFTVGRFEIQCWPRWPDQYAPNLLVNAVALIRGPSEHWVSIPNTPISAVALFKTGDRAGIPLYRQQYQLLGLLRPTSSSTIIAVPKEKEIFIS